MDKELFLDACRKIKARKRNKLDGASGICGAIYKIVVIGNRSKTQDFSYSPEYRRLIKEQDDFESFVSSVASDLRYDIYLYEGFVDPPYKWTAKRRRLLDKIIERLEK